MKPSTVPQILCLTLLLSTIACAAPKAAHHKARKPAAKPAAITAIEVYRDGGGVGGRHAGSGEGWTLRPDGTVERTVSLSPAEMDEVGDSYIPKMSGSFNPVDFVELGRYLQTSRLLDLKAPKMPDDGSASLSVSIVRGGKRKSIFISDAAPPSAVVTAGWVTLNLVRGITADMDWKDTAGHAINTGLRGHFVRTTAGLTDEQSYAIDTPVYAVLNTAGKQVATLQVSSESGYFTRVLPPGTYQIVFRKLDSYNRAPHPPPTGYAWRAVPATAQVQPGGMTPVTISLEKTPATP